MPALPGTMRRDGGNEAVPPSMPALRGVQKLDTIAAGVGIGFVPFGGTHGGQGLQLLEPLAGRQSRFGVTITPIIITPIFSTQRALTESYQASRARDEKGHVVCSTGIPVVVAIQPCRRAGRDGSCRCWGSSARAARRLRQYPCPDTSARGARWGLTGIRDCFVGEHMLDQTARSLTLSTCIRSR